jgi:hypothetical protein
MSWHFWLLPVMFFWFFGFRHWGDQSKRARAKLKARHRRRMGWDPGSPDETDGETARELEDQRSYMEAMELRIAELENRLDFTERLLAKRTESGAGVRGADTY